MGALSRGEKHPTSETPSWWQIVWSDDVLPRVRSSIRDTTTAVLFWVEIAIAHFAQLATLKFGWSPEIVNILEKGEDWAVGITVLVFLFQQFARFVLSFFKTEKTNG